VSELVWVSDWQLQCCGEEFAVGDEVTWTVVTRSRASGSWAPVLGEEQEAAITLHYERHEDEPLSSVTGVVRRIRMMCCRHAPSPPPDDPRGHRPVPGTGLLEDVSAVERWQEAAAPGMTFTGWLVDLDPSRTAGVRTPD